MKLLSLYSDNPSAFFYELFMHNLPNSRKPRNIFFSDKTFPKGKSFEH